MADVVTLADIRALRYCMTGVRTFCSQNKISLDKLIKEGIQISELRDKKIDNAMLEDVIKQAESRAA